MMAWTESKCPSCGAVWIPGPVTGDVHDPANPLRFRDDVPDSCPACDRAAWANVHGVGFGNVDPVVSKNPGQWKEEVED